VTLNIELQIMWKEGVII